MAGLRENIARTLSREPEIDEEFSSLIPPLTEEEYSGLEQSILTDGCRDAIILWDNIIVDGHNRYKICTEHEIPYRTETKEFANRQEVILWMLRNQLSRRNLNDFQRVEIVRKCENAVRAKAEQRMLAGKSDPREICLKGRATEELGAMAGVSHKTYERASAVLDNAPPAVTDAVRRNELSINAGYEITRMPSQDQAEIATLIEDGEKPSHAVSTVKKRITKEPHRKLTVSLTSEEYAQVKELASTKKTDMASMILELVREALHNHIESL